MAKNSNKLTGAKGEALAAKFLKKQGYKILKRNYVTPFGEVDIIVHKDGVVAFVEVKTSLQEIFGTPSERVDAAKMQRYRMSARHFFAEREVNCTVRFDIIEVYKKTVNHIQNAFY